MIINIRTSRDRFYFQALHLLRSIKPISGLTNREIEILALFMTYRDSFMSKGIVGFELEAVLFGSTTRLEVGRKSGVTKPGLRNIIHSLRTKGLITGRQISLSFPLVYRDGITFNFVESVATDAERRIRRHDDGKAGHKIREGDRAAEHDDKRDAGKMVSAQQASV